MTPAPPRRRIIATGITCSSTPILWRREIADTSPKAPVSNPDGTNLYRSGFHQGIRGKSDDAGLSRRQRTFQDQTRLVKFLPAQGVAPLNSCFRISSRRSGVMSPYH